jgi:hypothetical protein
LRRTAWWSWQDSNRQANDYWRWKIDCVERVASVREPEHLLLTRPCDRCIEKAGGTDAGRHADLAAVRARRIIGRGRAGAHSDLTGSSGVMERASLAPRENPTMYIAGPTSTGHGGISGGLSSAPRTDCHLRGSLGETVRDLLAARRCRKNQHSGPPAMSFRASPDLALCRERDNSSTGIVRSPVPDFWLPQLLQK